MAKFTHVTATSEENSYGITQGKWFDGKTDVGLIRRDGPWYSINELVITKVDEIRNLDQTCTHDSYYQCLAKRFRDFNFKTATNQVVNGSKCLFKQLCMPFSMPIDNGHTIPLCPNEIDQACYGHVIKTLQLDQNSYCKLSCVIKEFEIKRDLSRLPGSKENKNGQELVIEVKFDTAPESVWNLRSVDNFKTVKTEYLIISTLSFVGNVGGTMGMFVGFSFIGTSEWFLASTQTIWGWLKRKLKMNVQ